MRINIKNQSPHTDGQDARAGGWYYTLDDQRHGPVLEQDLICKIKMGEIGRNSRLWKNGMSKWFVLGNSDFETYCPTSTPPTSPLLDAIDNDKSKSETVLAEIQKLICSISGLPPLENFRWRDLFSNALKFMGRVELDHSFNCGCPKTTPPLAEVQAGWPQPRAFVQILLLGILGLAGFVLGFEWLHCFKVLPGLVLMGAFAVPLSCVVFFFEINVLRNISTFQIAKLILIGGVASIILSLILYQVTDLANTFLGATAAGIIEESGKLLAAVFLVGKVREFKWILNGLIIGAAIGAGFAGFESAGYILEAGLSGESFYRVLFLRAVLAPFCHVVWTAITVGALWKTKGDNAFAFEMLFRKDFLRVFAFVVVLHMLWNSGLLWMMPSGTGAIRGMFFFWIFMTVGSWYLALTLAQAGFKQVHSVQQSVLTHRQNPI